jgi:hypothetical protein
MSSADSKPSSSDAEGEMEELERDLAEPPVPLDGAPPEQWKHVHEELTEEERLKREAAREAHQERIAHGHPRGKI